MYIWIYGWIYTYIYTYILVLLLVQATLIVNVCTTCWVPVPVDFVCVSVYGGSRLRTYILFRMDISSVLYTQYAEYHAIVLYVCALHKMCYMYIL